MHFSEQHWNGAEAAAQYAFTECWLMCWLALRLVECFLSVEQLGQSVTIQ
jgi:hypothetical protein